MRSGWLVFLILGLVGCDDDVNCTSLDLGDCLDNYPECAYVGFVGAGNCSTRCYMDDPDCPEGTTCHETLYYVDEDQSDVGAACFLD